jgi:hypothetical protein
MPLALKFTESIGKIGNEALPAAKIQAKRPASFPKFIPCTSWQGKIMLGMGKVIENQICLSMFHLRLSGRVREALYLQKTLCT